ncbi:serine acetyltransferase [Candidatus Saccharibacteria bacterium]|nr:serine acetyltransferase [Candidatus Saccharibacteria bacterium]
MRRSEKWFYKAQSGVKFKRKMYSILLRVIYSFDTPTTIKCGSGLELQHDGLGVVLHPDAVIGNNVTIYQNVTIGGNGKIVDGKIVNSGAPIIEDDCAIFAGARVLGPIRIGKGSYIGANAVVTKDVPEESMVVGHNIIKKREFEYNLGRKNVQKNKK